MARQSQSSPQETFEPVRLDRWLWAARFYKTRTLAQEAVDGGKVRYDGDRAKPARTVKLGATLTVRQGWDELEVVVRGLSDHRGNATLARQLYEETEASKLRREQAAEQRRIENQSFEPAVRPNKKQRRLLDKLKQTLLDY